MKEHKVSRPSRLKLDSWMITPLPKAQRRAPPKGFRNKIAPHSVLRVFLKSWAPAWAGPTEKELALAKRRRPCESPIGCCSQALESIGRQSVFHRSWAPARRDQMKEERALAKRCHPHESAIDGCSQVLESITRQSAFLKSAKGAASTAKRIRNKIAPRSVLRVLLKSAKGAARTAKRTRNKIAPRSVLRVFPKSDIQ